MGRGSKKAGGALPATAVTAELTSLGPGFRFHPTDEELVSYYLKRKLLSKTMCSDVIGEVDVYKHSPSELAEHAKLKKTRDQEWFFFSTLDKMNPTGTNVNIATKEGYWKVTGKNRKVRSQSTIGMIKTLVFYYGRHPRGRRTNWLIHEYGLVKDDQIPKMQIDAYVLCKVFLKQNYGRPNGSTYAPFLEEEWDDDGGRVVIPPLLVVDANIINQIQQEYQSQSKNLIDLNKLPREFKIDDKNEKDDDDDEPLKRRFAVPMPCVLNKEAPLPLIKHKRKRKIDSSQITQDHFLSTETINDIADSLLEFSNQLAMKVAEIEPVATLMTPESSSTEQEPVVTVVPASSSTELINHLPNYEGKNDDKIFSGDE